MAASTAAASSAAAAAAAAATPANISRHYARIHKQWPRDLLRPTSAFTSVIQKRADGFEKQSATATTTATTATATATTAAEMKRVMALYSLLDDRFAKKWPIRADLLRPEANPNHYSDLMKDIDEAPTRTQAVSWWKNVSGKIRMS